MRKRLLIPVLLLTLLVTATFATSVGAASPPTDEPPNLPKCINMPEAQISGHDPGSACRVPMVALSGLQTNAALSSVYRSGWTNTHTSESDSDLSEDTIKVTGYYYWKYNQGDSWILGDDSPCEDLRYNQSHAACRTYGSTGNYHKQDGYHYFHTSGYTDDSFQTTDTW